MAQEARSHTFSRVLLAVGRLALFGLPGILAWLVAQPNLRPKYLPAAAWICVALSAASIGLGAVLGAIVPRSRASEPHPSRRDINHRNGAPS
jgi:hypothetical protein